MFSLGTPVFRPAITLAAAFVSEQMTTREAPNRSTALGTHFVASVHVFPVPGGPCSLISSILLIWGFLRPSLPIVPFAMWLVDSLTYFVNLAVSTPSQSS